LRVRFGEGGLRGRGRRNRLGVGERQIVQGEAQLSQRRGFSGEIAKGSFKIFELL
jgi:hypothetical protein